MKSLLGIFYFFSIASVFAAPEPLSLRHEIHLDHYTGKTFLETMLDKRHGIKKHLDEDYITTYDFTDWFHVQKALLNFDKKIVRRVMRAFGGNRTRLKNFVKKMQGREFQPKNMVRLIRSNYKGKGNIYVLSHFFAMASGAGTLVHIDNHNYYYNFGYKSGAHRDDVKSGRSYGATPLHAANDASCVMYLNELENYLTHEGNDVRQFYTMIMEFLTRTDVSRFRQLNVYGQAAATDYIAIYTAELDRHIMVNLNPRRHPWENDLSEATFLSIYSSISGKVMRDGALADASLKNYWAMSETGSGRSGIGIKRGDRRFMQRLVTRYMKKEHPALVKAVEKIIGGPGPRGDLFRGVMEYLNNRKTQRSVRKHADALTDAFVDFLMQVREDADEITRFVQRNKRRR